LLRRQLVFVNDTCTPPVHTENIVVPTKKAIGCPSSALLKCWAARSRLKPIGLKLKEEPFHRPIIQVDKSQIDLHPALGARAVFTDVTTYAISTAIVCAVGLIACYLPARRAVALDPVHALRN
jgi:hypothetical protein